MEPKMEITLFDEQEKVEFTEDLAAGINASLEILEQDAGAPLALSIKLLDDFEIAALNRNFRNIPDATDVLSFPAYELGDGKLLPESAGEIDVEYTDDGALFIGDIAISLERALAQSEEFGHSLLREVSFLTVHGALHLLGYDHGTPEDENRMIEMTENVLARAGISRD